MKPKATGSPVPGSGKPARRRRTARLFPVALALLALLSVLLRILMSVQVVATDPFAFDPPDVTDMATYHALSRGMYSP